MIPTYLSWSFHIAVHEEALNGVGLGDYRFLNAFFCARSFSTGPPYERTTLIGYIFTQDTLNDVQHSTPHFTFVVHNVIIQVIVEDLSSILNIAYSI